MSTSTAVAIVLAALSTTITSLAYLREHEAAAALPVLSMRRPLHSIRLLLGDRSWLLGFVMESSGFLLYAAALALAPLSLVQSINAGGIGVLAYVSARMARRALGRRVPGERAVFHPPGGDRVARLSDRLQQRSFAEQKPRDFVALPLRFGGGSRGYPAGNQG